MIRTHNPYVMSPPASSAHHDCEMVGKKAVKIVTTVITRVGEIDSEDILDIYASGWERREIGWVNDFSGTLQVG